MKTTRSAARRETASRPEDLPGAIDPASAVALVLTAVWLLGAAAILLFVPSGSGDGLSGLGRVVTIAAVALPVALIWVGVISARSARVMREESARLAAAVDAIRAAAISQNQAQGSGLRAPVEAKLDEIARAQRQVEAALARLTQHGVLAAAARPLDAPGRTEAAAGPGPAEQGQTSLALPTPAGAEGEPIGAADFVRAMNFPEDVNDAEGFRVLRLALKDRFSAGLIRSSQDVLTLLAEDGIYMDDLAPDRARPEVWRRFAQGERGRGVASLGGVRDRTCLTLTSGRMRQDPIFRDAAHHFLRKFDKAIAEFEPHATDAEIAALAETRTARAFMLLGRVSGTFD